MEKQKLLRKALIASGIFILSLFLLFGILDYLPTSIKESSITIIVLALILGLIPMLFAFYYWEEFRKSKNPFLLTPEQQKEKEQKEWREKIIFKEQNRNKIEAFSDKKLKSKWLILPYAIFLIIFLGGGGQFLYKMFDQSSINKEDLYFYLGALIIAMLAITPSLQEDDWEKILKIKLEIKSPLLDSYKDLYYTDSYVECLIHYLLRIYSYFFNVLGMGVLGLFGIYLAYSFLSSLTFSAIIVIVLVFIAIQLYEIKQKMR